MSAIVPPLTEIEDFRRAVRRQIWACVGLLGTTTLGALLLALLAFTRPIPVVAFDAEGRPILFDDTVTPRLHLERIRVEHFAGRFLRAYVATDAATVEEDFKDALNMMTPTLRAIVLRNADETARRRQSREMNLKSVPGAVEFHIARFDPEDFDGRVHLVVTGNMHFRPRFGSVDDGPDAVTRWFLTELALQRVPITRQSIHGLQVDFVRTRFFDNSAALDAEKLRRAE